MRGKHWAHVAVVVLLFGAGGLLYRPAFATNPWGADYFPNVLLLTQDSTTVRFYDDLLKGKAVAINLIYTSCKDECPLETARLVQVQRLLGDRVGKDLFFYSISIDPKHDTPEVLKARPFNIWLFFVHCCLIENKTPLAGGDTAVVGQRLCPLRSGAAQRCHGPWRVRAPPGRRSE